MQEDLKKLESLSYRAEFINKHGLSSASTDVMGFSAVNIKIIEEIEGKISQVYEKLNDLYQEQIGLSRASSTKIAAQALEEIDLFQKTTLFELRKAFE